MLLDTRELEEIGKEMNIHKVVDAIETAANKLEEMEENDLVQAKILSKILSKYYMKAREAFEHELTKRREQK